MCSAAETTFDSGAFATTMPRRVAASTSTLSTPTPARPITFSFVAALDQVGGQLRRRADDDRVVAADDLREVAVGVDVDVEARAQQLDAGLRDRLADEDLHVMRPAACSYASSAAVTATPRSMSAPSSASDELDRGERGRDVEDVEAADVAEPEDLALQVALPARDRDAEAVAQALDDVVGVDALGRADGGDDGAAVLVGREELEAHRLRAGAARAAEPDVPLERGVEALLEQQPERDVEPGDERDRRRERGVELLPAPCACAPSRSRSAASCRSRRTPPPRRRTMPRPGGVISAFCEPETTTSRPHASVSHGTAPRLETASTTTSAPRSFAAAASAWTSATTPVDVSEWTIQTAFAARSRSRARTSSGSGVSPHAYRRWSTSAP